MKYKFISFINLSGLTIGFTCCLLILCFVLHELSFDKYQPNVDQVYRVTRSFNNAQNGAVSLNLSTVAPPFGPLLKNDFGEIEEFTRTYPNGLTPARYNEKMFNQPNVFFADDKFFDFFKVDVEKGSPKTALSGPYSVMMSEETAKKYFGDEEPMNKVIKLNLGKYLDCQVTGIYKSFPSNTHFHPDMLVSFITMNDTAVLGEENLRTNFGNNSFFTYIRLPKGYDAQRLEVRFPAFLDKVMAGQTGPFTPSLTTKLSLQKLADIHLRSHTDYEAEQNGDIKFVWIFSCVALFILLIACINYMNLSTARSMLRAKEIGIRKVAGAQKIEIISQFLSESVLVSWVAMLLAFGLTFLLLPGLNEISGQQLSIRVLSAPVIMLSMLLVPFIVGIVSGIYPALFMSSFQPVKVLKGLFKAGGNISFRKVLVTFQFAISIILIICTAIVFNQMHYMQHKSLGYDKEHIVNIPYATELNNRFDAFRTTLLQDPDIKEAGRSSRIPTGRLLDGMGAKIASGDTLAPVNANIRYVAADMDFIPTYGIKIVAGRGFSRDFSTDTSAFLINEEAVKVLGFKSNEQAIGKDFGYGMRTGKLVGVFNDFHFESLHQKIAAMVLVIPKSENSFNGISIKLNGNNISAALAHIEDTWKKFLPQTPYQYNFLDDNFDKLYKTEERQKILLGIFACLAIFIACLGLFGLSAFAITQRIKEIGIRKVLGASVSSIVRLLSTDFLKLVVISAIFAFPVAWYAMYSWLQDFAYRISIPWWIFLASLIIAALIALFTIGFQAIKAAVANPVKSLRTE